MSYFIGVVIALVFAVFFLLLGRYLKKKRQKKSDDNINIDNRKE